MKTALPVYRRIRGNDRVMSCMGRAFLCVFLFFELFPVSMSAVFQTGAGPLLPRTIRCGSYSARMVYLPEVCFSLRWFLR